jgi:flagellar L-ring protein FlgH
VVTFRLKTCVVFGIFCIATIGIGGCVGTAKKSVSAQKIENNTQQMPRRRAYTIPKPTEGAIWTDNGALTLFMDVRAQRTGDTITVDIVENTSSNIDANTKASRGSSIDAGISQAAGYMRALEEANKRLNRDTDGELNSTLFKAEMKNAFDGKGSSDRSGQVTASIGAVVTEVLPNGNLVIFGKRGMRVNNETQFITVTGIVRPIDIDRDNRIKSTYIADARIEYVGQGVLADKQRPGWGTRLVDHIWPF